MLEEKTKLEVLELKRGKQKVYAPSLPFKKFCVSLVFKAWKYKTNKPWFSLYLKTGLWGAGRFWEKKTGAVGANPRETSTDVELRKSKTSRGEIQRDEATVAKRWAFC